MFIGTLLAILKFTSILLAGIMGTVGLLVDFKDKGGRITKWGRRALIGVVASTLIAATIHGIEGYMQRLEAKAASDRNESLLTEIRRGVYLLKDIGVSANIDYPLNHPSLQNYYMRLGNDVKELSPREYIYNDGSDPYISYNSDTNQTTAIFSPATSLFPRKKDEPLAWAVFSDPPSLSFSFYAKHRERNRVPDLRFQLRPESGFVLDYRDDQNLLLIKMNNLWVDHKHSENIWENNGRIISWEDLSGAKMFVILSRRKTDDAQQLEQMKAADDAATLGDISLQVSQRTYCISKRELKKVANGYTYTFPDELKTGECP